MAAFLGPKQRLILARLSRSGRKACEVSGTAMTPEQAARILRRLKARGLVFNNAVGPTPCTWTTLWSPTKAGLEALEAR